MSFLDYDLSDVQEPTVAPAGELQVRILGAIQELNKNGDPYLLPTLEVPKIPAAKNFSHYIPLPNDKMDAKKLNNAKYRLKTFYDAFGIDYSKKVALEDMIGKAAWVIVGVEEDDTYGEQNFIKKFIKPA